MPLARTLTAALAVASTATLGVGLSVVADRRHPQATLAQAATSASPEPTASPTPTRHVDVGVPHTDYAHAPHFSTPEAAMRYLAAAWNARDLADLKHVTDPSARSELDLMHSEATDLVLDHCDKQPAGDYQCVFTHAFPNDEVRADEDDDGDGLGHAYVTVGPADKPGWYMTVYVGCGG